MLSQPSTKRFLEAVQQTLLTGVSPALSSGDAVASKDAVVNIQAIDAILSSVIRRIGNEQTWMHEEIAQIEALAEAIIADHGDGEIRLGLDDLRANRASSERLEEIEADYARASNLLSRCAERAMVAGGPLRAKLDAVMEARLDTENLIRGSFKTVGKD